METYQNWKKFMENESEYNYYKEFIFWAFDKKQIVEGMAKLNLQKKDFKKIVQLGGGGFLLKSKVKDFLKKREENQKKLIELMKSKKFLIDAFSYELQNHEYCYTNDTTQALEIFDLKFETLTEFQKSCLKIAIEKQPKEF